ncbi:hypothetical protein AB0O47_20280 [Streptomyces noursei]|uniref:hypothetical protein n=1 Tax=Streptomyces noursei TaxID=1971 RepID=UPI0034510988
MTYERPDAFVEERLTTYADTAAGTAISTNYMTRDQADARYQQLGQPARVAIPVSQGPALAVQMDTDTKPRVQVTPDGVLGFGTGADDPDVTLRRVGPALLGTDGSLSQCGHTVLDVSQVGVAGGLATLGTDGKLTASQLPSAAGGASNPNTVFQGKRGHVVPPGWGEFWRPQRDAAKAGSGKATIAVIGGSTAAGFPASRLRAKSWPGLLATALQSGYGDGGTGYYTSLLSAQGIAGQDSTAITAWTTSRELISQTGTWTIGGYSAGPGWGYLYSSTTGDTLTVAVRGTTATIYTLGADGQHSPWTYTIDSGAAVAVTDTASTGLAVMATKITGLTAGTHTIKIANAGTTGSTYLAVCGVAGENSTGVVMNNFSRRGAVANEYLPRLRLPWNGGPNYPADLVIYAVSADDVISGIDADTWANSVRQHLSNIRDGGAATGTTDIVILLPHIGTADTTTFCYQDFIDRAHGLATAFEAAVINLWSLGRNSWNYWASQGYWADPSTPGAAGTDSHLMSDAGHSYVAGVITALLAS